MGLYQINVEVFVEGFIQQDVRKHPAPPFETAGHKQKSILNTQTSNSSRPRASTAGDPSVGAGRREVLNRLNRP